MAAIVVVGPAALGGGGGGGAGEAPVPPPAGAGANNNAPIADAQKKRRGWACIACRYVRQNSGSRLMPAAPHLAHALAGARSRVPPNAYPPICVTDHMFFPSRARGKKKTPPTPTPCVMPARPRAHDTQRGQGE